MEAYRSVAAARKSALLLGTAAFLGVSGAGPLYAGGEQTIELPTVEVVGDKPVEGLVGNSDTATEGTLTPEQIQATPTYREGEILESIPGVITTQHSGEGKANQYYLRGMNLDHGTDMAIFVDDMPVNLPSHGHGQGYSDLNFMIPELLGGVTYEKGPYFANLGDFSATGAAQMSYVNQLDHDLVETSVGSWDYARGLVAASRPVDNGNVLVAAEADHLNGPWVRPDDYRKYNGVIRYSQGTDTSGWTVTGMAYSGVWNATNQVPLDLINSGQLPYFGTMNPTDGGNSQRFSLDGRFIDTNSDRQIKASVYVVHSELDLFNDFTYFLNDPVNGDQFHQHDNRTFEGGDYSYTSFAKVLGLDMANTIGAHVRMDEIDLGLYQTADRMYLSTDRTDSVDEGNAAIYVENKTTWLEKVRTVFGLRADQFWADDQAYDPLDTVANGGPYTSPYHNSAIEQGKINPKGSIILGPWNNTEFYVSAGEGYHSNDVRTVAYPVQVEFTPAGPAAPGTLAQYPLLEKALGYEVGVRSVPVTNWQASLALFQLHLQSEQVFDGDAAMDTPSGPSTRTGVEFANLVTPVSGVILDADVAYTIARFDSPVYDGTTVAGQDDQTVTCCTGRYIQGSPALVIGAGLMIDDFGKIVDGWDKWFGGLRWQYYGPRPLTNDDSVRSPATSIVNLRAGYKLSASWTVQMDIDNLLNARAEDVGYYYLSRVSPTAIPSPEISFHAAEPLSVKLTLIGQL